MYWKGSAGANPQDRSIDPDLNSYSVKLGSGSARIDVNEFPSPERNAVVFDLTEAEAARSSSL